MAAISALLVRTMTIWMTPFASVAMLEELALLKIAFCSAPASTAPLPTTSPNAFISYSKFEFLEPSILIGKACLKFLCYAPPHTGLLFRVHGFVGDDF